MPVTFSPSALAEARKRLYGAKGAPAASNLARIEQDAYQQQDRIMKDAAKAREDAAEAQRKADDVAAKAAAKTAKAEADAKLRAENNKREARAKSEGRGIYVDADSRIQFSKSDEAWERQKAEKARKLQQAKDQKQTDERTKAELAKVEANQSVLRENEQTIDRAKQREELNPERAKYKRVIDEYEKHLKAYEKGEKELTDTQAASIRSTIEKATQRVDELDAADMEKKRQRLDFATQQDQRRAALNKREAAVKRGDWETLRQGDSEPLITDPVQFEQAAAVHEAEVQAFTAEQAQQQAKMAALEAKNARLMSMPHAPADVSTDGKWHKDLIPEVNALVQSGQSQAPGQQEQQAKITAQAQVLNESAKALNAQAEAENAKAKAQREAQYVALGPKLGPELKAVHDAVEKHRGGDDAGLMEWADGEVKRIQGSAEKEQVAKQATMKSLWDTFGKYDNSDTSIMGDWTKIDHPNFDAAAQKAGLDVKQAREQMETMRRLDWSSPLDEKMDAQQGELARGLKEKLGLTEKIDQVRVLPGGDIVPNPVLGGDEEAFLKAIKSAGGTAEQQAKAKALWPEYRRAYGKAALEALSGEVNTPGSFPDFVADRSAKSPRFAALSPEEQVLEYLDNRASRGTVQKYSQLINRNLWAGFGDIATQIVGVTAAATGNKTLSELAGTMSQNMQSVVVGQEFGGPKGIGAGIIGQTARMLPGMALAISTGSLGGAAVAGAVQTGGAQYADSYDALMKQPGMDHDTAWKRAAVASGFSGVMTAALTAAFPGGATAVLNKAGAAQLKQGITALVTSYVKAAGKGFIDEVPQEVLDEGFSQLSQAYAEGKDPNAAVQTFLEGLPELIGSAGLMGAGGGALERAQSPRAPIETTSPEALVGPDPAGLPEAAAGLVTQPVAVADGSPNVASQEPAKAGTPNDQAARNVAAQAAIASFSEPDLKPEKRQAVKAKARVVLKISNGAEVSDLTDEELRDVGLNRDGKPGHYEQVDKAQPLSYSNRKWVKGEGQIQPVVVEDGKLIITQQQIDSFGRRIPAVAEAIGLSEVERRKQIQDKEKRSGGEEEKQSQTNENSTDGTPAPRPEANAPQEAAQTGNATPRSGQALDAPAAAELTPAADDIPMAWENQTPLERVEAFEQAEEQRATEITRELSKRGVDAGEAQRIASEIVGEQGVSEGNYVQQMTTPAFAPALKARGWEAHSVGGKTRYRRVMSEVEKVPGVQPAQRGEKAADEVLKGKPEGNLNTEQGISKAEVPRSKPAKHKPLIEREDWQKAKARVVGKLQAKIKAKRDAAMGRLNAGVKHPAQVAANAELKEVIQRMNMLEELIDTQYAAAFDDVILRDMSSGGGLYAQPLTVDADGRATSVALVVDLDTFMEFGSKTATGIERTLNEEMSHRVDLMVSSPAEAVALARAIHAARPGVFNAAWQQYHAVEIQRGTAPAKLPAELTDQQAFEMYFEATRMIHQGAFTTEKSELPNVSLLRKFYLYLNRWIKQMRKEIGKLPKDLQDAWQSRIDIAEIMLGKLQKQAIAADKAELDDYEPPAKAEKKKPAAADDIDDEIDAAWEAEQKARRSQRTAKQKNPFDHADKLMGKVPGPKTGTANIVTRILNMGGITRPSAQWLARKAQEGNSRATVGDWDWLDTSNLNWWEKRLFPRGEGSSIDQELQRMHAEGYFPEAGTPGDVTGEMLHAKIRETLAAYERLKAGDAVTPEQQADARMAQEEEDALLDEPRIPITDEEREAALAELAALDELVNAENNERVPQGSVAKRIGDLRREGIYSGGFLDSLDARYFLGSARKRARAQDAEYMAAVESGDTAKQQALVDAAAKAAGYTRQVFHGTEDGGFQEFDPERTSKKTGFVYFSTGKGTAASYSGSRRDLPAGTEGRGNWTLYLKEPEQVWDFEEAGWDGNKPDGTTNEWHDFGGIDGIAADAKRFGIKSFEVQNVLDEGPNGGNAWYASTIAVSDPSLIKSADPITRDADGNVIPLSQRFNPESNSILYSAPKRATGPSLFGEDNMNFLGDRNTLGLFEQKAKPATAQMNPKKWAATLPSSATAEGIQDDQGTKSREQQAVKGTPFVEGQMTADPWGDDPFVYRDQWIDPREYRDNLKLEGLTYEQVVRMPSTQQYMEWYREGSMPPPITAVFNEPDKRLKSINRRRLVAALETGQTRIPGRVEIGKASEVMGKVSNDTASPVSPSPSPQVSESFSLESTTPTQLKAEEARKKLKAELQARQDKPLIGTQGDIGQMDMLGGNDLLSMPVAKPEATQGKYLGYDDGNHFIEELREALGVNPDVLKAFDPEKAVVKRKDADWTYQAVSGTIHPDSYPTRSKAIEAAQTHLKLKQDQYAAPKGYTDIIRERARKSLKAIAHFEKQGMSEIDAAAEARKWVPDVSEYEWKNGEGRHRYLNTPPLIGMPDLTGAKPNDVPQAPTEVKPKAEATPKPPAPAPEPRIGDFGEKIGGARKDYAVKGEKSSKPAVAESQDPGWRKRYTTAEIVSGYEKGRWSILDTRKKDWTGSAAHATRSTFATEEEAEKHIPLVAVARQHAVYSAPESTKDVPRYAIWRKVTDRKMVQVVKETFASREDALKYMLEHAEEIIETKTSFGEEILAKPENAMRKGEERRTRDADAAMFQESFGFRGVEFGNWMRDGGTESERQEVLNHAFDGLHDLADVLDIPPKAISLNGDLALAFGARGHGLTGAKAHYERDYAVINLTKMAGAGSLAHEWFHALDHYLGRQDGKAARERKLNKEGDMTYDSKGREGDYASHGFSYKSATREELRARYKELMERLFTKAEQFIEDTQKAEKFVGDSRGYVVDYLAELRKDLAAQKDPQYYKRNNKPATAEQLEAFDTLSAKIIEGEDLASEYRYNKPGDTPANARGALTGRWSNDSLDALSAIFKAVRGRAGMNADGNGPLDTLQQYMKRYKQRIDMLASATAQESKTKMVPTEYAMDAKRIDQGRASDYWTTEHEMAARAFSAYVEDKVKAAGGSSQFLSYGSDNRFYRLLGMRPFPEGKERETINKLFDEFFGEVKVKETEQGMMLFSAAKRSAAPAAATPFYSKLSRVIAEKMPNRADSKTVTGIISNPQTGIKAEELKWSGVLPWLEAETLRQGDGETGRISKQAVLDYLASDGAVQLEEVRMGSQRRPGYTAIRWTQVPAEMRRRVIGKDEALDSDWLILKDGEPVLLQDGDTAADALDRFDSDADEAGTTGTRETKFAQYQLPGGENYREVVLAMPDKGPKSDLLEVERLRAFNPTLAEKTDAARSREYGWFEFINSLSQQDQNWVDRYIEAVSPDEESALIGKQSDYTSSHFPDVPNYVAHARLNDRTDAEGQPGTFIEEIQSDRHQAGREKGYQGTEQNLREGWTVKYDAPRKQWLVYDGGEMLRSSSKESEQDAINRSFAGDLVPDAPFRTTWPLQMFKRALAEAVAAGKQWIGWTTGDTQAERYDLSKQIKSLHYDEASRSLVAYGLDGEQVMGKTVEPAELPDYIGKDAAEKLMAQKPNDDGERTLHNADLKMGGEGMKGFYDTIMPKEISKYVKQWGAGVKTAPLKNGRKFDFEMVPFGVGDTFVLKDKNTGKFLADKKQETFATRNSDGEIMSRAVAKSVVADFAKEPIVSIWRVDITPQMRAGVEAGQALFSAAKRSDRGRVGVGGRVGLTAVAAAAHEAATSPQNDLPEPTEAQREAGNYAKGHVTIAGHEISIENPAGSKRRPEWPALQDHYGYFKGTNAKDGDHVDVFVKPGTAEDYQGPVHVVRQVKVPENWKEVRGSRFAVRGSESQPRTENGELRTPLKAAFDEYKVMLGYSTAEEARAAYLRNYEPGWPGMQRMTTHSAAEFARIKESVFTVPADRVPGVRVTDKTLRQGDMETGRQHPPVTHTFPDGYQLTGPGLHTLGAATKRAYHGTPHKVDKFSTSKIGTGEGAQAYGWGLYFAEEKQVGMGYRIALAMDHARWIPADLHAKLAEHDKLTEPEPGRMETVQAWLWQFADAPKAELAAALQTPDHRRVLDTEKAIQAYHAQRPKLESTGLVPDDPFDDRHWTPESRAAVSRHDQSPELEKLKAELEAAERGKQSFSADEVDRLYKAIQNAGNLYTVELLPDADEFLDWDKPLSEQSGKVKAALKDALDNKVNSEVDYRKQSELARKYGNRGYMYGFDKNNGSDIYQELHDNPSQASEALAKVGIPGIRYLDGNSRGKITTERFVIEEEAQARAEKLRQQGWKTVSVTARGFEGDGQHGAWYVEGQESGTSNYVIFDENLVRILEENGKPVENQVLTSGAKRGQNGGMADPDKSALDAEYMAAVEAGDTTKQQAMVDAAAKAAGYNVGPVFHATDRVFTEFKSLRGWSFFAMSKAKAQAAAQSGGKPKIVIRAFVKSEQTLGTPEDRLDYRAIEGSKGDSLAAQGYDAVWIADEAGRTIAVRSANQIKSADPVTRDADGNVIPLSQRFNTESDSILFSAAKRSALDKTAAFLGKTAPTATAAGLAQAGSAIMTKTGLQKPLAALGSNNFDKFLYGNVFKPLVWNRVASAQEAVKKWLNKPGALNGIGKAVIDQTLPLWNVPREYLAHYHEAQRKAAWGREKAMDVIRALSHDAKVSDLAYPKEFVEDPSWRVRMFDAMEGKTPMYQLPEPLQKLAARLRLLLEETGRDLVKQGLLNLDTFNELRDTGWMPRYTEDEAEAAGGSWLKAFKLGVKDLMAQRSTAFHIVDTTRKDPRSKDQYAIVSREEGGKRNRWRFRNAQHMKAWYEDFVKREAVRFLQDGGKDVTNLMAALSKDEQDAVRDGIRGLTREAVDLPGTLSDNLNHIVTRAVELQRLRYKKEKPFEPDKLIKDPVYSVARYVMAQTHNAATMEILKHVAKNKEWTSDVSLEGHTEIPDNPRFGPLAKKHLRADIATQVLEHVGVDGAAMQFYDSMLRKWKAGKLVLNPGSHVRDAVGNTVFAYLGGNSIWNPGNLPYYRDAITTLRDGGNTYAELIEQQVLGGDAFTTQVQAGLKGLLPDTKTVEDMEPGAIARLFMGFGAGIRGSYEYLSELRKLPDDFYKTAAYLKYKSQGMSPAEAAAEVRKWFPYYDRLGSSAAWKQTSRFAMPFSAFFRESTRVLGRAAMERPLALSTSLMFASMVTRYSLMMLGLGDDDEEAIKRSMRGKLKFSETPGFSMLLPSRTDEGQLQQWDISAVMPFADLLGSKVEMREGEDTWTRFFRSMFTASPITAAAWGWSTNTDAFSGKKIVQEDMGVLESTGERLKDLAGDLLPPLTPFVGVHATTLDNAGRRTGSLEMRNKYQSYLRAIVGLDVRSADPNLYTETKYFREKNNLPLNNNGNTYTTPLKSRLAKDIKGELIQDAPNIDVIAAAMARLEASGNPVKSPKQMGDLLDSLDPAKIIKQEFRRKLINSFSPEAQRVYQSQQTEFKKANQRVPSALSEARKKMNYGTAGK